MFAYGTYAHLSGRLQRIYRFKTTSWYHGHACVRLYARLVCLTSTALINCDDTLNNFFDVSRFARQMLQLYHIHVVNVRVALHAHHGTVSQQSDKAWESDYTLLNWKCYAYGKEGGDISQLRTHARTTARNISMIYCERNSGQPPKNKNKNKFIQVVCIFCCCFAGLGRHPFIHIHCYWTDRWTAVNACGSCCRCHSLETLHRPKTGVGSLQVYKFRQSHTSTTNLN